MIRFTDLWRSHPSNDIPPINNPCSDPGGGAYYSDQCAIRLGVALAGARADLGSFPGVRCWRGHGRRHLLRAEELARWLRDHPGVAGRVEITKKATVASFLGRRGIALCRNFWGAGNRGDHIDAWNGTRFARGDYSFIALAEEVWFWQLV